jgi:hypothetical protein
MVATTQIWWTQRGNMMYARAYGKTQDEQMDLSRPGRFTVIGGSMANFGINVPAGFEVRGFNFNTHTGAATAVLSGTETGSRVRREFEFELEKIKGF